ncbi:hypothetical protein D3C73_663860 [compost metagenome]
MANGRRAIADPQQAHRLGIQARHQDPRLIGELQPLDTAEPVSTVPTDDAVGHGDRAVGVLDDGVVGQKAGVQGRVEGGGIRQDLTDGNELAGVVSAAEHERLQLEHAVERCDLRTCAINVLPHADTYVEPLVTVDQVIATTTFDDVAAAAAEDDVAGAELIVCRAHNAIRAGCCGADERAQAADQVEVGEHAALSTGSRDHGGIGIIATQDVAEVRSRQTFHQLEPSHGCGQLRQWRRDSDLGEAQVDGHAERVILEAGPVVTGATQVAVPRAAVAEHDIVATFSHESVGRAGADEDVVTAYQVEPVRVEIVAGSTIGGSPLDPVVTFVTHQLFVGETAHDEVVARAAEDLRGVLAGDDEVLA